MADPIHRKRLDKAAESIKAIKDPLERLDAARKAREQLEQLELAQVRDLRDGGTTWSKIASLYGLTKQGAQQRFRAALKN